MNNKVDNRIVLEHIDLLVTNKESISYVWRHSLISIAISLKRIADSLSTISVESDHEPLSVEKIHEANQAMENMLRDKINKIHSERDDLK